MAAKTLEPPYYAVIFTAKRKGEDEGYGATVARMQELASKSSGYLGVDHARDNEGFGITISYWKDEESISSWKKHEEHKQAQQNGKDKWYQYYSIKVCKVEREYSFTSIKS